MSEVYRPPTNIGSDEFKQIALNRQPGSIRDIQYLYGKLYSLGKRRSNTANVPSETRAILTPDSNRLDDIRNEPDSVVIIDLEMDRNSQTISCRQLRVTSYDSELEGKLAYAEYPEGRAHDHSITHLCGSGAAISTAVSAAQSMFDRWPTEEGIKQLHDTHTDGWILSELARLGNDDDFLSQVASEIKSKLSGSQRRLVTVRIHTDGEETAPKYPIDIGVFCDAIHNRAKKKLATKNNANAKGIGAGYVRGDSSATVFGTATDPLKLYTSKKRSWFDRFDEDRGVHTHPITLESAVTLTNSDALITACRRTDADGGLYYLPYFAGKQTPEKLRALYDILWSLFKQDASNATTDSVLRRVYDNLETTDDTVLSQLRFWVLHIVSGTSATRKRALTNTPSTAIIDLYELATESKAAAGAVYSSNFFTLPHSSYEDGENYSKRQLDPTADHLIAVDSIDYFLDTCHNPGLDDNGIMDTVAPDLHRAVTTGSEIAVSDLFEQYTIRLRSEFRAQKESGDETNLRLRETAIRQYIQLQALTRSGYLTYDVPVQAKDNNTGENNTITELQKIVNRGQSTPSTTEMAEKKSQTGSNKNAAKQNMTTTDAATYAKKEAESYREFVDSHNLLSEHPQRRASFTLGALITTAAGAQYKEGIKPVTDQFGPTTITKRNIKERVTQIINLVNKYASKDRKILRYDEMLSQLADDMQYTDPINWEISTDDIQFHVGLGMAYGASYRDYSDDDDDSNSETNDNE